jgi:glycerate dehydrogenase
MGSPTERIVFLDRDTFQARFKRPSFDHEWRDYPSTAPDQIVERLRGATIAITNKVPLGERELSALPDLRMIAVAATGVDRIDLAYCRQRGITVANVPDYARHTVPEHVFMLILALRRNLIAYREALQRGAWQRAATFCLLDYPIHDINGSVLGIIGYGLLGRAVARLARAFGMRVLIAERRNAAQRRPGRASFEEVLRQSDIITLHCPLTPETRGLIGAAELEMMRPTALLINCARGGLVDEGALAAALRAGRIAGAGFDVLADEPPRAGNPLADLHLANFIQTPHIAWASLEAMQMLADSVVDNIEAFIRGEPKNVVRG